jgi:hypothetical protein
MTDFDDLLAELAAEIDGLSAPAGAALFVGCCQALRVHYDRWADHRGTSAADVLDEALAAARTFATGGQLDAGAPALLARVEEATPEGDSPDAYSSTFAQDCWICGDVALRAAIGQDGPPGYAVEYALDPIVITVTERLFGVSQLGSGPDEDAGIRAILAESDVQAAVDACRTAIAHLATHPAPTDDDLATVAQQVTPISPP